MQVITGTPLIALLIENTPDQRLRRTTLTSRASFRRATPNAPMRPNTACAIIIAAAGVRRRARDRDVRVAAGAIVEQDAPGVTVRGALAQMGPHRIDRDKWDLTRSP